MSYQTKRTSSNSVTKKNNQDLDDVSSPKNIKTQSKSTQAYKIQPKPTSKLTSPMQSSFDGTLTNDVSFVPPNNLASAVHAHQWKQYSVKQQNITFELHQQLQATQNAVIKPDLYNYGNVGVQTSNSHTSEQQVQKLQSLQKMIERTNKKSPVPKRNPVEIIIPQNPSFGPATQKMEIFQKQGSMMSDKHHSISDKQQSPNSRAINIPQTSPDQGKGIQYEPLTVKEGQYKRVDIDLIINKSSHSRRKANVSEGNPSHTTRSFQQTHNHISNNATPNQDINDDLNTDFKKHGHSPKRQVAFANKSRYKETLHLKQAVLSGDEIFLEANKTANFPQGRKKINLGINKLHVKQPEPAPPRNYSNKNSKELIKTKLQECHDIMVPQNQPIKIEQQRESPQMYRNAFQGSQGVKLGTNQRKNISPPRQETQLQIPVPNLTPDTHIIPSKTSATRRFSAKMDQILGIKPKFEKQEIQEATNFGGTLLVTPEGNDKVPENVDIEGQPNMSFMSGISPFRKSMNSPKIKEKVKKEGITNGSMTNSMEAAFVKSKELVQDSTDGSFSPNMKIMGQRIDSPKKEKYEHGDQSVDKKVHKVVKIDLGGDHPKVSKENPSLMMLKEQSSVLGNTLDRRDKEIKLNMQSDSLLDPATAKAKQDAYGVHSLVPGEMKPSLDYIIPSQVIDDVTEQTVSIGVPGSQEGNTPFNNTMNTFAANMNIIHTTQTPINDNEFANERQSPTAISHKRASGLGVSKAEMIAHIEGKSFSKPKNPVVIGNSIAYPGRVDPQFQTHVSQNHGLLDQFEQGSPRRHVIKIVSQNLPDGSYNDPRNMNLNQHSSKNMTLMDSQFSVENTAGTKDKIDQIIDNIVEGSESHISSMNQGNVRPRYCPKTIGISAQIDRRNSTNPKELKHSQVSTVPQSAILEKSRNNPITSGTGNSQDTEQLSKNQNNTSYEKRRSPPPQQIFGLSMTPQNAIIHVDLQNQNKQSDVMSIQKQIYQNQVQGLKDLKMQSQQAAQIKVQGQIISNQYHFTQNKAVKDRSRSPVSKNTSPKMSQNLKEKLNNTQTIVQDPLQSQSFQNPDTSKAFNPNRAKKHAKVSSQNRKIYDLSNQVKLSTDLPLHDNNKFLKGEPMSITGGFAINSNIQLTSQAFQDQKILIAGYNNDKTLQEYQIQQTNVHTARPQQSPVSENVTQLFNNEKILSKNSSNILIHQNQAGFGIDELIQNDEDDRNLATKTLNQGEKKSVIKKNTTKISAGDGTDLPKKAPKENMKQMQSEQTLDSQQTKSIGTIMHKNIMIETNIEEKGFYINTNLKQNQETIINNSQDELTMNSPDRFNDNIYADSKYMNNDSQNNKEYYEAPQTEMNHNITPVHSKKENRNYQQEDTFGKHQQDVRTHEKVERVIHRENIMNQMPQNLSFEVNMSKNFGGRNALNHLSKDNKNKLQKIRKAHNHTTVHATQRSPKMPAVLSSQISSVMKEQTRARNKIHKTPKNLAALNLNPDIHSVKEMVQPKTVMNSNSNQVTFFRKTSEPLNQQSEQQTNSKHEANINTTIDTRNIILGSNEHLNSINTDPLSPFKNNSQQALQHFNQMNMKDSQSSDYWAKNPQSSGLGFGGAQESRVQVPPSNIESHLELDPMHSTMHIMEMYRTAQAGGMQIIKEQQAPTVFISNKMNFTSHNQGGTKFGSNTLYLSGQDEVAGLSVASDKKVISLFPPLRQRNISPRYENSLKQAMMNDKDKWQKLQEIKFLKQQLLEQKQKIIESRSREYSLEKSLENKQEQVRIAADKAEMLESQFNHDTDSFGAGVIDFERRRKSKEDEGNQTILIEPHEKNLASKRQTIVTNKATDLERPERVLDSPESGEQTGNSPGTKNSRVMASLTLQPSKREGLNENKGFLNQNSTENVAVNANLFSKGDLPTLAGANSSQLESGKINQYPQIGSPTNLHKPQNQIQSGQVVVADSNEYTTSAAKPLESKLISNQNQNKQPYRSSTTTKDLQTKNFHLKPMDIFEANKPNLSKKQEKSMRDHLVDQIVARDAIQSILHSTLDGSKPQIIMSNPADDPQIKYVRRIKNNDFWNGKNAEKQHETLISPYSQDYQKKCILHHGPQAVAEQQINMISHKLFEQELNTINQDGQSSSIIPPIRERFQSILKGGQMGLQTQRHPKIQKFELQKLNNKVLKFAAETESSADNNVGDSFDGSTAKGRKLIKSLNEASGAIETVMPTMTNAQVDMQSSAAYHGVSTEKAITPPSLMKQQDKNDFRQGHYILRVREHQFADRNNNFTTSRGIITKHNTQDYQKIISAIATPKNQNLNRTIQANRGTQKLMLPNVFSTRNDLLDKKIKQDNNISFPQSPGARQHINSMTKGRAHISASVSRKGNLIKNQEKASWLQKTTQNFKNEGYESLNEAHRAWKSNNHSRKANMNSTQSRKMNIMSPMSGDQKHNQECQAVFSQVSDGEKSGVAGQRMLIMETAGAIENQMRQTWMMNAMSNQDKIQNI